MSNTPNLEFFPENDYIAENSPESLVVNVDGFEGPLDMLLTLSRAQKVDLLKISISQLVSQYLDFVAKAKELMMTSNEINGEELNKLGVLYKLTNAENMDTVFKELIEKLNEQSFISICMVKQQIKDGLDLTFEKSIGNETINQNSRFQHSDVVEGMTAFFEKRQPNYKNTLDE